MTEATGIRGDASTDKLILLVDDEEGIRIALSRFLTRRGFQVKTAADGKTALELLALHSFQLMICDLRMPGMSGMEVTASAMARDATLAVIMLTGTNEATTGADVLRIGASDYLTKPIELAVLNAAIDRALERRMQLRALHRLARDPTPRNNLKLLP